MSVRRCRVVLADDDSEIRMLLRATLERDDRFEVAAEAPDGATALEMVWRTRPDAVVLDIEMPVLDGLRTIPELKKVAPGVRIVVLSGSDPTHASAEALNRGADAFLRKGVAYEQVAEVLAEVCGVPSRPRRMNAGVIRTTYRPSEPDQVPAATATATSDPTAIAAATTDDPVAAILSRLTHDLLTPITVIQGFAATLLQSAGALERSQIEMCAEAIDRRARDLTAQIRRLGDARAIERGDLRLARTEACVDDLVRAAVQNLAPELAGRAVRLDLEAATACVDPDRFTELVSALVHNAAKHTKQQLPVAVSMRVEAGSIRLTVTDAGPGIPADRVEEAFTLFGRLDAAGPGSGLGLFVARGVARAHGGDITIEPAPSGGARVVVSIPVSVGSRPLQEAATGSN